MTDDRPPPTSPTLRPPRNRLERRAVVWWFLQALVFPTPLFVGAIVAWVLREGWRPWAAVAVAALGVVTLVALVVEPAWRYLVHRWEVTDTAVYSRSGWVVREWRIAPISRIQTVDAVRGPFEQLLGLSTLRVTTASSQGQIDIPGLDHELVAELAQRLTDITEQTPGDAT